MRAFAAAWSRIVPTVDRAKATVMTKIRFEKLDPRILPEMSAKVSFLSQAGHRRRPEAGAGGQPQGGGRTRRPQAVVLRVSATRWRRCP
jgi:HlyD family secretion protein